MEQRTLGRTGVHVSPLCLGTMMFGAWGETAHDSSIRVIHKALDAGVNFIDTADVYSRGESEEIVGKALVGANIVLATKFHGSMGEGPNQRGNSRRWNMQEVEASLKGLQPTGSTSTRCTAGTPGPTTTRRSARRRTWSPRATGSRETCCRPAGSTAWA